MIEDVTALVPASLSTFGCRIDTGPGRPETQSLSILRDKAAFDAVVDGFGRTFGRADRRAVVSLWTQYYLSALIIPYLTALSRLGRALPIKFERVRFELDETGIVSRFLLAEADIQRLDPTSGLTLLIDGHLRPFFDLCHTHSGLSRGVLWGNAGVVADLTLRELTNGAGRSQPLPAQSEACLGRCGADAFGRCPLAQVFHAQEERRRRVCCMRYRLPGVVSCGTLCPVDHPIKASC